MTNPFARDLEWIEKTFTEISAAEDVVIDLKYATTDNFMGENLYGGFARCFLHPRAAESFSRARRILRERHPGLRFKIWDALRPRSVQSRMFERLRGTPLQDYVAPPVPGSLHAYGMALDLTLQDPAGVDLSMGTPFDDFDDLAQPAHEEKLLASGRLNPIDHRNRLILRTVMHEAGFRVLPHEWWHFNAAPSAEVHGKLPSLD